MNRDTQRHRLLRILQRHIPADADAVSDDALVRAVMTSYDHWRAQPLVDPNE